MSFNLYKNFHINLLCLKILIIIKFHKLLTFSIMFSNIKAYFKNLNYKNLAYIGIVVVNLLLSMFFSQMNNASDGSFGKGMDYAQTFSYFIILLLLFGYSFYLGFINNIIKYDKKFQYAMAIGIFFVVYSLLIVCTINYKALCWTNLNGDIAPRVGPNTLDKIKSVMDTCLMVLLGISVFFLFPAFKEKRLFLSVFSTLLIGCAVVCIIYSLCTEMDTYIHFCKNFTLFSKDFDYLIYSFFKYANVYGHVLYLASINILFLAMFLKKRWIYLFNIIFAVFIVFSQSRTAFLGIVLMTFLYCLYLIYDEYFRNKKIFYFWIGFLALFLLLFILELFVFKVIKIKDDNKLLTLADIIAIYTKRIIERFDIIELSFTKFLPTHYIFGVGVNLNDIVMRTGFNAGFEGVFNMHNGFFEALTCLGVPLILVYLLSYYIVTKESIQLFRKNHGYLFYIVIMFISYWFYMVSEAFPLFYNVFGGAVITLLLFALPHNYYLEENGIISEVTTFYDYRKFNSVNLTK